MFLSFQQKLREYSFKSRLIYILLAVCMILHLGLTPVTAQQKIDEEYTAKIREFSTDGHFLPKWMDNLPYSEDVPTPLDILGHIAGARDILTYTKDSGKAFSRWDLRGRTRTDFCRDRG